MPYRLRASSPSYLTEDSVLTYLRAIESDCLLIRGEAGMLANAAAVPTFVARKEAFGPRLKDLVLPGSHHLHVSRFLLSVHGGGMWRPRR